MDNTTHPLLVPRWKVINDYPEPHNHPYYEVGYIIQAITNEDVQYLSKYPALFEPLPWYAERDLSTLPSFVKIDDVVYKVDKWEKHFDVHPICFSDDDDGRKDHFLRLDWYFKKDLMVPATLEDYLTYKSSTEGRGGEV